MVAVFLAARAIYPAACVARVGISLCIDESPPDVGPRKNSTTVVVVVVLSLNCRCSTFSVVGVLPCFVVSPVQPAAWLVRKRSCSTLRSNAGRTTWTNSAALVARRPIVCSIVCSFVCSFSVATFRHLPAAMLAAILGFANRPVVLCRCEVECPRKSCQCCCSG